MIDGAPSRDGGAGRAELTDPAALIGFMRALLALGSAEEVAARAAELGPALLGGATVRVVLQSARGSSPSAADLSSRATWLPLTTEHGAKGSMVVVAINGEPLSALTLPWAAALADAVALAIDASARWRTERGELAHTRDFLQRVIESSVDGIVSADLRGRILVYNQAASRIFGYAQEDVIGTMNVEDLYPPGIAREVMRRIRSTEFGERGRLSDYRVEMVTQEGDRIPVALSASLVMDGRHPVGTVGIFTDVRGKLAMEARLLRAQLDLQMHEKQAAIAELAGAAAHELNQPLTAVMGYAEYLKRTVGGDAAQERAIDVILGETERMANIVRKVGRITRYETKPYVGGAKIVDIDASSAPLDE